MDEKWTKLVKELIRLNYSPECVAEDLARANLDASERSKGSYSRNEFYKYYEALDRLADELTNIE